MSNTTPTTTAPVCIKAWVSVVSAIATEKTGPHSILMALAQIEVLHCLLAMSLLYMPHKFLAQGKDLNKNDTWFSDKTLPVIMTGALSLCENNLAGTELHLRYALAASQKTVKWSFIWARGMDTWHLEVIYFSTTYKLATKGERTVTIIGELHVLYSWLLLSC